MSLWMLSAGPVRRSVIVAMTKGPELERVVQRSSGRFPTHGESGVRAYLVDIWHERFNSAVIAGLDS